MNEKVQPFVDIIGSIYDNMDKTVHDVFSDDDTQGTASATAGDTQPMSKKILQHLHQGSMKKHQRKIK